MVRLRLRRRRRSNPEGRMSVMSHLRELRRRIVTILLIIAAGAVVGWIFYDPILAISSTRTAASQRRTDFRRTRRIAS